MSKLIKRVIKWNGWSAIFTWVYYVVIVLAIYFGFNYLSKDESQETSPVVSSTISDEEVKKQEIYESEMKNYCSKSVNEMTGVGLFQCKDFADFGISYMENNFEDLLKYRPDIPVFCDRKIVDMKVDELVECLEDE